jgi:hypothetical protein
MDVLKSWAAPPMAKLGAVAQAQHTAVIQNPIPFGSSAGVEKLAEAATSARACRRPPATSRASRVPETHLGAWFGRRSLSASDPPGGRTAAPCAIPPPFAAQDDQSQLGRWLLWELDREVLQQLRTPYLEVPFPNASRDG